ncbi:SMP-30/gluconolactonase/LRE family protein [Fulvivirga sp. 29W222]|uniref:SMP-30/gluconolactonase/LRE family protein n=1 Tax=Fulvivirga marina TaxID=2494733 RepID=A0A937FXC6_9BACT|nr:SMP-30/gluconolactonase/LRE family protein [Fulvivirga marina]MBL6447794.1 SMP-30/gluconolactonase/LRE family protein [Fulvivirga marina]
MRNKYLIITLKITAIITGVLAILIASALFNSHSAPLSFNPPPKPTFTGKLMRDSSLMAASTIPLGGYFGPEDFAWKAGYLYSGARSGKGEFHKDGAILKTNVKTGQVELFAKLPAWVGAIHFAPDGQLIVAAIGKGIMSVDSLGNTALLASHDVENNPFKIPNDIDISKNGKIYFSVTSHEYTFSIPAMVKIMAEARPVGGIYCYDPETKTVETISKGFLGINGISLTQDESAIIAVEMGAYRLTKVWLKGSKKGKREIIASNLPGFANNIVRRENGTFWLAFSSSRIDDVDNIHPHPFIKKIVLGLPEALKPQPLPFGLLLQVDENGTILKSHHDPFGEVIGEISSVYERGDSLYLGGDFLDHINVLDISGWH